MTFVTFFIHWHVPNVIQKGKRKNESRRGKFVDRQRDLPVPGFQASQQRVSSCLKHINSANVRVSIYLKILSFCNKPRGMKNAPNYVSKCTFDAIYSQLKRCQSHNILKWLKCISLYTRENKIRTKKNKKIKKIKKKEKRQQRISHSRLSHVEKSERG